MERVKKLLKTPLIVKKLLKKSTSWVHPINQSEACRFFYKTLKNKISALATEMTVCLFRSIGPPALPYNLRVQSDPVD